MRTAEQLAARGLRVFRAGIWKPRTKPGHFEGVGKRGLAWLAEVKRRTHMRVATEVATREHAEAALDAGVDILWIGARTSSNPFAVQEIADTLRGCDATVLVKNPITPDVDLWQGAIERIANAGITNIGAIHRGFGAYGQSKYRNKPQWDIPIALRGKLRGISVLCDPSHISGRRELVEEVCQTAFDMNMDGLIVESHIAPACALSDAAQQLSPTELSALLGRLKLRKGNAPNEDINILRTQIDEIDGGIVDLLARRMKLIQEIGKHKKACDMAIFQDGRYDRVREQWIENGRKQGLDADFLSQIYELIHSASVHAQLRMGENN